MLGFVVHSNDLTFTLSILNMEVIIYLLSGSFGCSGDSEQLERGCRRQGQGEGRSRKTS